MISLTHARFLAFLMVFAALLAWSRYFIQDDAFISFTYARNFAEGQGLTWYPGSREFGYTNFLFTFLVGLLMTSGVPAEAAAATLSVPAYLGGVALVFYLTAMLSPRGGFAPHAAAVAAASHYTLSSYATGGLETSLHMLLILLAYFLGFAYVREHSRVRAWHIAAVVSAALLCRLDSALLLMPVYAYLAFHFLKRGTLLSREALIVTGVPILSVAVFLYGCYAYYGSAFPNTFYAKLVLFRDFTPEGWAYLRSFLQVELCAPLALFLAAVLSPLIVRNIYTFSPEILCLFGGVAVWLGYIVHMGGDFMEFRLLVPVLPLFYAACFALLGNSWARAPGWIWGLAGAAAVALGFHHQRAFSPAFLPVTSIPRLHSQVTDPRHNWQMVGKALGKLFYTGSPEDVTVAVHTSGAIPYHSRLPTVDIYGINDGWVARHGRPGGRIAGHRRIAPFEYLVQRKVNLVFPGLPLYACGSDADKRRWPPYHALPVMLIPLESGCRVMGYYLAPHPKIDALVDSGEITRIR